MTRYVIRHLVDKLPSRIALDSPDYETGVSLFRPWKQVWDEDNQLAASWNSMVRIPHPTVDDF